MSFSLDALCLESATQAQANIADVTRSIPDTPRGPFNVVGWGASPFDTRADLADFMSAATSSQPRCADHGVATGLARCDAVAEPAWLANLDAVVRDIETQHAPTGDARRAADQWGDALPLHSVPPTSLSADIGLQEKTRSDNGVNDSVAPAVAHWRYTHQAPTAVLPVTRSSSGIAASATSYPRPLPPKIDTTRAPLRPQMDGTPMEPRNNGFTMPRWAGVLMLALLVVLIVALLVLVWRTLARNSAQQDIRPSASQLTGELAVSAPTASVTVVYGTPTHNSRNRLSLSTGVEDLPGNRPAPALSQPTLPTLDADARRQLLARVVAAPYG